MDWRNKRVHFRIRDVYIPEAEKLVMKLHGDDLLQGTVVEVAQGEGRDAAYAVISVPGLDEKLIVKLDEILDEMGMVAEGVKNTLSAHRLAAREGVELPHVATMHAILYGGLAVADAVDLLMGRALRAEREW